MAGNYSGDMGSYSHPGFTEQKQANFHITTAPTTAVPWACFASRNKVLVNRVYLKCISSPSATAGTLCVQFHDSSNTATTLKALTVSQCTAKWNTSLSFTAKTLETITQYIAIVSTGGCDKGDWMVVYDYQVLYPVTYA